MSKKRNPHLIGGGFSFAYFFVNFPFLSRLGSMRSIFLRSLTFSIDSFELASSSCS